jgi:hypothetical protein
MRRWLIGILLLCGATVAEAEPANGFMMQGEIAANLVLGGAQFFSSVSPLPSLRLGGSWRRVAAALEVNYSTFATSHTNNGFTSTNDFHVVALGPVVEPVLWRSAEDHARLYAVVGFNLGAVISGSSSSGGGGASFSNHNGDILGGFNLGLLGQYFIHRNFALGVEGGIRAQFVNVSSTLYSVADAYVGLVLTFIAGR